jgi:uncharacterized protein involved in outer membrane biogenesis
MKRVIVLALCLIGLIAVAVAAIPFLVSTDLAKRRIAEEIGRLTGRAVSFAGEPRSRSSRISMSSCTTSAWPTRKA